MFIESNFVLFQSFFFLLSENCKIVSYPVAILCITISVNLLLFLRKLKSPPWFVFFWSSFKCVEHEIIEENFLKHNYPLKHLGTPPSEIIFYFCNLLNSYNKIIIVLFHLCQWRISFSFLIDILFCILYQLLFLNKYLPYLKCVIHL